MDEMDEMDGMDLLQALLQSQRRVSQPLFFFTQHHG